MFSSNKIVGLICPFLLIVAVIIFWLPTVSTPYWWDSAGFIVHADRYYLKTNFSSFFLPPDSTITTRAHPPLFPFLLALTWKFFGESLLLSHLFYLIFVFLTAIFAYLLGKEIANSEDDLMSCLIGLSSAFLLFFTPVFLAQVGIIYLEIPMTAFGLMAVYFFLTKRIRWYLFAASLMLLMKVVSLVIILAILGTILAQFLIKVLRKQEKDFKKTIRECFIYGLPILVLAAWFIIHKIATGWLFVIPAFQQELNQNVISLSLSNFIRVYQFFFLSQKRWLVSLGIIITLFLLGKKVREVLLQEKIILFFLIILFVPLLFGLEFLHRYIIFGLPFLFLLFSYFLGTVLLKKKGIFAVLILGLLFVFSLDWNNHRKIESWRFPPLEENLEYLDVIEVGKQTAGFIEKYHSEKIVFTAFPLNYMLAEPFQHYVSKPIKTYDCKTFREGDRVDLIVFHLFSPGEVQCLQMIQRLDFRPLATFEKNGKRMEIYNKK